MRAVILYPLVTEKAEKARRLENKVVFCVDRTAAKGDIRREVERLYEVRVEKVNTFIRPDGSKIAYVKLKPEHSAEDLAVKLGLV